MLAQAIRSVFRTARNPGPTDDFWYRPAFAPTSSGVPVNDSTAMMLSTFWACMRVLSDTVGCLPIHTYQRNDDERKSKDMGHVWYIPLHDKPNPWQTPIEFKSMLIGHLLLRGNFYARIDPPLPQAGKDSPSLVPLAPDRMQRPVQDKLGFLTYKYTYSDGQNQTFDQGNLLHIKLLTTDGFVGMSPLTYARETIGLASAQTGYASGIFGGGGFLKYYLKTTKRLGAEGRKNFREGWRDLHGDPRNFEPPILEDDMDIHTLGMNNEDAQFLESRKFSAYELCQFMGVPPHLVFLLDRATWANTELQGIDFLTVHLNPYLVRIEQGLQSLMGDGYFCEFLRDAVVRGDLASRYTAYNTGIQAGFLTRNEVRAKENMDPLPGGDELLVPLNMGPAGENGKPKEEKVEPEPEDDTEEVDDDEPEAVTASLPVVTETPVRIEFVTMETITHVEPQTITQDEPKPAEQPTAVEPSKPGVDLQPLIADVAARIVAREIVGLNARIDKSATDPQAYFRWSVEWFEKHREYVAKAVAPLLTAARSALDPQVMATEYCDHSVQEFASKEPAETLKLWNETKAAKLAAILGEKLCTTGS